MFSPLHAYVCDAMVRFVNTVSSMYMIFLFYLFISFSSSPIYLCYSSLCYDLLDGILLHLFTIFLDILCCLYILYSFVCEINLSGNFLWKSVHLSLMVRPDHYLRVNLVVRKLICRCWSFLSGCFGIL